MSKIAVCINAPKPAGELTTDIEINIATVKLQGTLRSFNPYWSWPFAPISVFPTRDILAGGYITMQLTALRGYNWEIGMSDQTRECISQYSKEDQRARLEDCKTAVSYVRSCRDPLQPVYSYLPQGTINQDTVDVLNELSLVSAVVDYESSDESIKILVPNCYNVNSARDLVLAGKDVVLQLDLDCLPTVATTYGIEYLSGTKNLISAAKSVGAKFVCAKDF